MTRAVHYAGRGRRDLKRLDEATRRRVVQAVDRYAAHGVGNVKRLSFPPGVWRLRVGEWRVLLTLTDGSGSVRVLSVNHRSRAYR